MDFICPPSFFLFFVPEGGLPKSVCVGWGRGCPDYCKLILILHHLSPSHSPTRGPSELGGLFLKSCAQRNGCGGNVGDSAQRITGIISAQLKFEFMGFVSLARGFLVVELTFLFAGIKVSGS